MSEVLALEKIEVMSKATKFSPEIWKRAVRMVFEHQKDHASQWAMIESNAPRSA